MICPVCGFTTSKRIEGMCTNCTYDSIEKIFHSDWQAKNIIIGLLSEKKTTPRDLAGVVDRVAKETIREINNGGIDTQLQYLIDTVGATAVYEILFGSI